MSNINGSEPSIGGPERFRHWCIVELFGHQIIAGEVSDQAIGGETFIRVDVPAIEGRESYTKLYGKGAIYAITPCTEETARRMTQGLNQPPINDYHFRPVVPLLPGNPPGMVDMDEEGFSDD